MPVSALKGSRSLTQGEGGRSPSLSLLLEALLWVFHNNRSGLCFQSYETIAEATHCARSTAAEAIRALGKIGGTARRDGRSATVLAGEGGATPSLPPAFSDRDPLRAETGTGSGSGEAASRARSRRETPETEADRGRESGCSEIRIAGSESAAARRLKRDFADSTPSQRFFEASVRLPPSQPSCSEDLFGHAVVFIGP